MTIMTNLIILTTNGKKMQKKTERDPVGWDIFNFVNFEKLIYMKL